MINKTTFNRTPKDATHLYNMYAVSILNDLTDYNEIFIMITLLSNSDIWIVNRIEIQKKLQKLGMGFHTFNKAWKSLQNKKYIICERFKGGVHWIINEDPNSNNTKNEDN